MKNLYGIIFSIVFFIDRLSKFWALYALQTDAYTISSWCSFNLVWNRGISWSLLTPTSRFYDLLLISFIGSILIGFVIYIVIHLRLKKSLFFEIIILAGGLSNFFDRFLYGAVLDFIQLHWNDWYWPTFNIADSAIVIGVLGILFLSLLRPSENV